MQWDSLHSILRMLYEDMMPLCEKITGIASGVAGLGALLYISYRVWQSLARAEPLDLFPLLRPFAIGLCIMFFPTLVLGSLNGILSPIVTGTHEIVEQETLKMNRLQQDKDLLERENLSRDPRSAYLVSDEQMDREIEALGWSPNDLMTIEAMYEKRGFYIFRSMIVDFFRWLLELLFKTAALVIDTIRTFYLIVLSILGPLAFSISVFDGFQSTLTGWLGRYISVYLWLPVTDLFSAMLSRIQVLSLQKDLELMSSDPFYFFDSNNIVYLIFLIIGIFGYFTIPSVAGWIVQAGGFGAYNRKLTQQGSKLTNFVASAAGAALGTGYRKIRGAIKASKPSNDK